ncbi:MAG: FmdB family zinc ribbon protein [Fidelibacterota bacterium]
MPTYDYKCNHCKQTFELFQAMSDEPLKVCPHCGGEVRRLVSGGTGLIFKGSGFYITDYARKNGSKTETKQESKNAKAKETKDETK